MRKEDFFEVLGELDGDIVNGAKTPIKKKMRWKALRTAAAAAVLAVVLTVPAAAYVIETVRYNAAVEYLKSLGVNVVDLSDYSRKEIINAVEVYDAMREEDSIINSLLPNRDYAETPQEPVSVTSEQVRQLTPEMTATDVVETLGKTVDIGSGILIMVYKVDDMYTLTIPFAGNDAQLGVYGEDLLKALQPLE